MWGGKRKLKEFIDKTAQQNGTNINRESLMAIQGFQSKTIVVNENTIIETNSDGHTLTTTFNDDGSITEVFQGEKTITLKTIFTENGLTQEVIE